ncbi:MAG: SH3 domain-containing protein [Thiobacillus sp.]
MKSFRFMLTLALALPLAAPAWALQFRSTARPAVMYDAPSQQASKVAVSGAGVPFEVFVETDAWIKVRDVSGRLAWLEKSALGNTRNVVVNVPEARVYAQASTNSEVRFRVARGVLLNARSAAPSAGWFEVQHADGMSGWIRQHEVWGE